MEVCPRHPSERGELNNAMFPQRCIQPPALVCHGNRRKRACSYKFGRVPGIPKDVHAGRCYPMGSPVEVLLSEQTYLVHVLLQELFMTDQGLVGSHRPFVCSHEHQRETFVLTLFAPSAVPFWCGKHTEFKSSPPLVVPPNETEAKSLHLYNQEWTTNGNVLS